MSEHLWYQFHPLCADLLGLCCRYGHVIHGLCATQSVYGNLNNLTVETDFVEAPVRTYHLNINMTKSVLLSTVNIAVPIP